MAKTNKSWDGFSLKPRKDMPEGLWVKCPGCEETIFKKNIDKNLHVCPLCGHHFRVSATERIAQLADEGSFEEIAAEMTGTDPLEFKFRGTAYSDRMAADERKSGVKEAITTGKLYIKGRPAIVAVMDPTYLMGSMGSVVGEKFCLAADRAIEEKLPFIVFTCSGGARMHEGVVSLGQMAKTSAAVAKLDENKNLFVTVLCDPTTGGVTASFAMLGDVIIAEPKALIGFAGPRTIYQTIKVELPEGFQRSEFLVEHGFVDQIVERKNLRSELARLIDYTVK